MLDILDELKNIYRNDLIPLVPQNAPKELTLFFPDLNLTIETDRIVDDTFELSERLCSTDDIALGACEGAMVKLTVANLVQDLSGYEFVLTQTVNGIYTMPLGSYKVESCKKQNDLWFREITAYDSMKKTDVDVSTWYNGLTFPITVKAMRESLLTHLGLSYEVQTLTNDTVQIPKTINPTSLVGRDVLRRLCEINAGFGHFTRSDTFKVIQLSSLGLYPSETLYPEETLFPSESSETMTAGYKSIDYEEYTVEPITQLQISQEDGDEGVVVGVVGNLYKITENFLLYGKTGTELTEIANNILLHVKNKYYRPHNTVCVGLPYIEVGDALTIIMGNDAIETFIFTRTLKGIQALEDEFTATGNQKIDNRVSPSTQIQQLRSRTLKLKQTLDEVSSVITDLEQQTETAIKQLSDSISLKVSKAGVISAINLSEETAKIEAPNIQLEGLVTANNYFKVLTDGSIETVNAKVSGTVTSSEFIGGAVRSANYASGLSGMMIDLNNSIIDMVNLYVDPTGKITAANASISGDIVGSTITGSTFNRTVDGLTYTTIDDNGFFQNNTGGLSFQVGYFSQNGYIKSDSTGARIGSPSHDNIFVSNDGVFIDKINLGTPITTYNTNSYINSLYYGGSAQVTSYGNNFRPHSSAGDNNVSCGSPSYRWTQVFAGAATISTSDENEKQVIGSLSDTEKRVAQKIKNSILSYRFNDAVEAKGSNARIHFGVTAQRVKRFFEEEGLDVTQYALYCSDTWYEKDGSSVDKNEMPYRKEDEGVSEKIRSGIRYEELLCFIAASQ